MKRSILLLCALAACSPADDQPPAAQAPPVAASVPAAPDTATMNRDIRATIDRYYDGFTTQDLAKVDSVLHPNAVFVHMNGAISRGEEPLRHMGAGKLTIQQLAYDVVDIRTFGDDFALVDLDHASQGRVHGREWGPTSLTIGLARTNGGAWEIVYLQAVPKTKAN
jgi:uncharacterized protein (TIGR02246 family)